MYEIFDMEGARIQMTTTVEIEDDVREYLDDILHADGAEAWYCGGIELDLQDYNGAIKSMANGLYFQRRLADENLSLGTPPFEVGIKVKEKT